jgi:ABC-type Fe3+-hydroxamate transport system substrate-binding protein
MTGTDARGTHLHQMLQKPKRIVSLVPSQTELLYHLGLDEAVIGITKFCIHPAVWFRSKTRIGGTKSINIKKIKSLQPDLILANKEENVKEQVEELAQHFPVWVTDVSNLPEALDMIETIGFLIGLTHQATFLKTHIAQKFQQLRLPQATAKKRVCYLIWKEPYLTVGGDTFINNMLEQAGFENIVAHKKRYPEITLQQLKTIDFDLLMLSSEPYPFAQKHLHFFETQLPGKKVMLVDGEYFSWYGSRLQWAPAYFKTLQQL